MNFFESLLHNEILIVSVVSWALAQILKTLIHATINKGFNAERLVGAGGMPSSHSATVCALSTATALVYSVASFEFAMAAVFAIVTMYDAMGVRRETGRQGEVLNDLLEAFNRITHEKIGPEKALKELIGHTPLQVISGAILGVAMAFLLHNVVFH